ncbi:MAG: PIN domain-containing protein [Anaerolineae bacterium]
MPYEMLLDSTVLISHLRRRRDARLLITSPGSTDNACISVVSRSEVLAGMPRHEEAMTMALLGSIGALTVTEAIADRAGRWIYQYARKGVQLTLADALIAATAVEYDLILVTGNAKHFPMSELRVHLWGSGTRT